MRNNDNDEDKACARGRAPGGPRQRSNFPNQDVDGLVHVQIFQPLGVAAQLHQQPTKRRKHLRAAGVERGGRAAPGGALLLLLLLLPPCHSPTRPTRATARTSALIWPPLDESLNRNTCSSSTSSRGTFSSGSARGGGAAGHPSRAAAPSLPGVHARSPPSQGLATRATQKHLAVHDVIILVNQRLFAAEKGLQGCGGWRGCGG